jgi:hypothetical protein
MAKLAEQVGVAAARARGALRSFHSGTHTRVPAALWRSQTTGDASQGPHDTHQMRFGWGRWAPAAVGTVCLPSLLSAEKGPDPPPPLPRPPLTGRAL